ncbi:hypothetical protein BDQ12DRAFT_683838 [Crucibulum laeve]|uniref:Polyketide synthase n=1 Tax=Crucibulum laeve TaxID=68775 RepID=A0A5C3M093_9AGAR|nr:hypothetical protein BDQ12DRAFT_683838 [Crucibulum laeve]
MASAQTLLDVFIHNSRHPDSIEYDIVECADERWTYGELDTISTGLAIELHAKYGLRPVVAIIAENHPYTLATIFAVWKLCGVVAPLDYHAPSELLKQMLLNIEPACVVVLSTDTAIQDLVKSLSIPCAAFSPVESTITSLMQRFVDLSPELSPSYPLPTKDDLALYIHTSSASSIATLKCVPLMHGSILAGSRSRVAWWRKTWPNEDFERLRVLGWSPWSHIIAHSHDLGAATLLTGGCYIFALTPSSYATVAANAHAPRSSVAARDLDISGQLLDAAKKRKPTIFTGVPWVLEGFMARWKSEKDSGLRKKIGDVMRLFKIFGSGGAGTSAECLQWAKEIGLRLVLDMGMTELGGPIFHARADESGGWRIEDRLLYDSELILDGSEEETGVFEGELHIRSSIIGKGYLKHDSSAFSIDSEGKVTFRTGDIYERTVEHKLIWKGRREDFIHMSSGESLDPRIIEGILNQNPAIAHCCIVGNNFLKGPSQVVCAIIEPSAQSPDSLLADITRAIASVNRTLAPPLRIAWSRVLILSEGQHVPYTRKGAIFRKKLEDLFGSHLSALLSSSESAEGDTATKRAYLPPRIPSQLTEEEVGDAVIRIIAEAIGIPFDVIEMKSQSTFAELGMDSTMAVNIVNRLNRRFGLSLPLNTCHTHVDLIALRSALCSELGISGPGEPLPTSHPMRMLSSNYIGGEVVIVGQALRLPQGIDTPELYWEALLNQRTDIMTSVPVNRWDHKSFYRPANSTIPAQPCDITFEKAGFIDLEHFDHAFFGISSAEAFSISPTVRLTLETSFEAFENANIPISNVKGTDMGVFVAAGLDEGYNQLLFLDKGYGAYTRFYGTGIANSTACGRLSYLLDVHGPSVTVDTACSAGMVAFDQAVKYLQSGEGEAALVCGVNTHTWPGTFGFLSAQKMTSINSRCATFTNEADGYVPCEGSAAMILKTKRAAIHDGDIILASVKATDVKHDGRSQGLVAPNIKAQIAMQRSLLEKASLKPNDIDLVETHGTATILGDLIEIQGINEVFQSSHTSTQPLLVGAAKTCIGHTEIASGLFGVMKTLSSFTNALVPGLVHLTDGNLNPSIDLDVVPLYIPHATVELPRRNSLTPFRAVVLANGFAGTNAGTILEEYLPHSNSSGALSPQILRFSSIFVVSAKTGSALLDYLERYLDFCRNSPADLHSICYTSCIGREHYRHRFACVVSSKEELIIRLEERISSHKAQKYNTSNTRILFAFPGQGSQYEGMARDLYNNYSGFRTILVEAATKATALVGYAVLPLLVEVSADSQLIDRSEVAQVCIFIYQHSICKWLATLGIEPHGVMGHSLGEIAAAVTAGALTFEVALQFIVTRAHLFRPTPDNPGGMVAVLASEKIILSYIQRLGFMDRLAIAVYNGKDSLVISGELDAVKSFAASLKQEDVKVSILNVDQGFHSSCIDYALPKLNTWLQSHTLELQCPRIPYFSPTLGQQMGRYESLNAEYWVGHARNPVKFAQTASLVAETDTFDIILDVGPQPTIWTSLQSSTFSQKTTLATTRKKGEDQDFALLMTIAALFQGGATPNFMSLFSQRTQKYSKTSIPMYPYKRQLHYPTFIPSRNRIPTTAPNKCKSLSPAQVYPFLANQALCDLLKDHRIEGHQIVPGAALVDFVAHLDSLKAVEAIHFHQPLVLDNPDPSISAEIDNTRNFIVLRGGSEGGKVCSGSFSLHNTSNTVQRPVSQGPPNRILNHEEIYESFNNVHFGPLFRNIQEVSIWKDRADATIYVENSGNTSHDRTRKLDACLHMFGAIAQKEVPQLAELEGAFLPASLNDFYINAQDLPCSFICRYHLPLDVERNFHVISAAFDVLSHTGEILISCRRYSVAWIPSGVAIQEASSLNSPTRWMYTQWNEKVLSGDGNEFTMSKPLKELLYVGIGSQTRLLKLTDYARTIHLEIPDTPVKVFQCQEHSIGSQRSRCFAIDRFDGLLDVIEGSDVTVILDVTTVKVNPGSQIFSWLCKNILSLMKYLISSKIRIINFLAISSLSAPVHLHDTERASDIYDSENDSLHFGAVVQGMLRVFRRETGLDNIVWGIDLPNVNTVLDSDIQKLLKTELIARQAGVFKDTLVAYRQKRSDKSLLRLVPTLQYMGHKKISKVSGTTIIVGMGSIGVALAVTLVSAGTNVIFLGRRPGNDIVVMDDLARLKKFTVERSICAYVQADVADVVSLLDAVISIQSRHGPIESIIHTAAIVNDSSINNVTESAFEEVLRPKILGAWNLHIISEELSLPLKSFVLLSSISVPLGNPGQVAYVAGNAFMDSLAAYRHGRGLPTTSLQLGAWESKLIENLDLSNGLVFPMRHKEGIPLILEAMSVPVPVQLIAHWDTDKLSSIPVFAQDPFFAGVLSLSKTNGSTKKIMKTDVIQTIEKILRTVLELHPTEQLDTRESLTSCGLDSISFAQIRGRILKELEVEVPMMFLSDSFSIKDMIDNIVQSFVDGGISPDRE